MYLKTFLQSAITITFVVHSVSGTFVLSRLPGFEFSSAETPWQVSIEMHEWHYCVGSIITNKWVITTASCTE